MSPVKPKLAIGRTAIIVILVVAVIVAGSAIAVSIEIFSTSTSTSSTNDTITSLSSSAVSTSTGVSSSYVSTILTTTSTSIQSTSTSTQTSSIPETTSTTASSGSQASFTSSSSSTTTSSTTSYPGLISFLICPGCTVYENPPYTFPTSVPGPCDVKDATKVSAGFPLPPSQWPYTDDTYVYTNGYSTDNVDQLLSATVAQNGSLVDTICLSCNNSNAPSLFRFKIHPDLRAQGDWILLDVENSNGPMINQSSSTQLQVERNNGYYTNLWVASANGSKWYQLTNFTAPAGGNPGAVGILAPQWSPNGSMVAFSETYKAPDLANEQGYWNFYVADFGVTSQGIPYLYNETEINYPGDVFYEMQTFSPDGSSLIVQSVTPGMNAYGVDLYSVSLVPGPNFGKYTDITNSPYSWDEHAVYSPSGQKIAWISSLPFPNIILQYGNLSWSNFRTYLHNEFFIMNANGTGVEQITWFNTPSSPESTPQFGDTMYAEWNLAGTELLIHNGTPEIQVPGGNSVWLLQFAGVCG